MYSIGKIYKNTEIEMKKGFQFKGNFGKKLYSTFTKMEKVYIKFDKSV